MEDKITFRDKIRATLTPTRIVTFLTPIIFVPLAGFITLQLAKYGVVVDNDETLETITNVGGFLVGSLVAYLSSAKWLDGRHEWENNLEEALNAAPPEYDVDPFLSQDEDEEMLILLEEKIAPIGEDDEELEEAFNGSK